MLAITRRHFGAGLALLPWASPVLAAAPPTLEVWKMRGCACCAAWARHFEAAGFGTTVHEQDDLGSIRTEAGVPEDLGGCHTARVPGYVVEGHVPVAAVQRLLAERPAILGLAVPGMPMNSPGMEIEGEKGQPFDVIAFAADGSRAVFMTVQP
jgi:hypothetical protein